MILRKYGDIPATHVPDVGEVVEARTSVTRLYRKAVVLDVSLRAKRVLRIKVQWLDGLDSSAQPKKDGDDSPAYGVLRVNADGWPLLIKQISKGQPLG